MKKLISALAVVFAIAASYSCQREADYITDPTQAVTVTYNVSLDQVQKTKATLDDLDNSVAVNKLFYSVYVQSGTGTSATYTAVDHSDYHKVVDLDANGTAEVTIKLIENDTYKVVFWAQKDDAYLATGSFAKGGLEDITIDYTASDSYASDKDAFTAYDVLEISPVTTDTSNGKSFQKEIHLKRPFAQINFGADDGTQAAALGYTPNKVIVTVKQAATKFNAATGVASTAADAVFKQSTLGDAVNFTVNSKDYQRIGKAYVLPVGTFTVDQTTQAITDALSANVDITLDLQLKKSDNSTVDLDARAKANVPVRSNYRTNLLGSLITTDVTFNVVVDNDYDGSTDYISIVTAGNAANSDAVTLTQPETISSNINFGTHPVTLNETLTIGADLTISGGTSITVNKSIVVAAGKTLTLDNVTINPSSTEATITIEPGASLIINGGTYTADNTQVLFDLLSGGSNPAPVAPGVVRPRAHGADGDQLIIRGGTFTGFDPTPYVDTDHYTVTGTDPYTVAAKQVTLTVETGDVTMKVGDAAVLKTLTVDPSDTDLTGISFEYSVANVATASYNATSGKIEISAVAAGSTVITVKVGTATATINVTVLPADSIEVAPASLSIKVGQTSDPVTVTLNNEATVSSVVSNNANCTVNWTSGNTFTVTGAAIGESVVTVTASNSKTATVAVTVSKADAVKLSAPVLSTANADADATSIMLSWTAVEHASGYAVSYGAESPVNVNTNEVTLSNLALATEYTISVVAKGDGDAYTDSDASNAIVVTTEKGQSVISIAQGKDDYTITVGTTANIEGVSITYNNEAITGATPVYSVDNEYASIIEVNNGVITAKAVGEAAIAVDYAGNTTYKAAEQQVITVNVVAATLESITVDATYATKTFTVDDTFNHNNVTVTAHYNNSTTADVTAQATFSEPDMTTAGTKTVTVTYGGKSASYDITVNEPAAPVKTDQSITLTLAGNSVIGTTVNKAYGDAAFTVTAEAPSNNVVLTSGNTSVATVSGTTITIVGVGSAVITANAAETESYNAAEPVSFTVAVAKADLAAPTVTATAGDDKKITVSWSAVTGAASYTVKIGETETANATSPFVTAALENGTYSVSVKAIGDANHNDSAYSTAQNVEIADAQVTPQNGDFVKVSEISEGDYLIIYEEGSLAFDGSLETLDAVGNTVEVTISNDVIAADNALNAAVFTIEAVDGDNNYSILSASGKYIGQTSDANGLSANENTAYVNTITFDEGNANIVSGGAYLRYNSASNQTRFRYYKSASYSAQKAIALYKKVGSSGKQNATVTINGSSIPTTAMEAGDTFEFSAETTSDATSFNVALNSNVASIEAKPNVANTWIVTAGEAAVETEVTLTVSVAATNNFKAASATRTFTVAKASTSTTSNDGSLEHPYTASEARTLALGGDTGTYYISGIVTKIQNQYSAGYGTANFWIDENGQAEDVFEGYKIKYFGNTNWVNGNAEIAVNDEVIINGTLTVYNSTTPETSAGYLVSLNGKTKGLTPGSLTATPDNTNKQIAVTWGAATGTESAISYVITCGTQTYNASAAGSHTFTMADYGKYDVSVAVSASDAISGLATTSATLTDPNSSAPDYSTLETSNVTLTAGTNGSAASVNGQDAIKVGKSSAGGDMSVTVPSGTTKLHVHAAAWNGVTGLSLNISGATVSPSSISLTADTGIANNSPFTLSGKPEDFYFEITLSGVEAETTITFTSSIAKRFVIWGVNAE